MNRVPGKEDLILSGISVSVLSEDSRPVSILEHIDLSLSPGEWLFLVGVNGSGKSTLARLLAGLSMEGVSGLWNRGFAGSGVCPYVMQQPDSQLFGETPREEIMFALEWLDTQEAPEARAEAVLASTGLLPAADLPWSRLSGGQRQLAAVAAATAGSAPLVVFDEATSMLDETARGLVLQIAKRLQSEGTAIVWVTQRLDELDAASRVTALSGGRVVFDGTGGEFLFGDRPAWTDLPSPCEQCGLRLPYWAALAAELGRLGKLSPPYPVTMEDWQKVLEAR